MQKNYSLKKWPKAKSSQISNGLIGLALPFSRMVCKNNRVPNDHLRKDWFRRIKYFFDDPARKQRRQTARAIRAKKIAPRPVEGPLRPLVHCPTVRYNRKMRLGRGFTVEEVKAAGFEPSRARYMGIAMDKFRAHTKDSIKEANIERLKAYKAKMVRVHTKTEKLPKGETIPELYALPKAEQKVTWRVIKAEEQKTELFKAKQEAHKAWRKSIKDKVAAKHKK